MITLLPEMPDIRLLIPYENDNTNRSTSDASALRETTARLGIKRGTL